MTVKLHKISLVFSGISKSLSCGFFDLESVKCPKIYVLFVFEQVTQLKKTHDELVASLKDKHQDEIADLDSKHSCAVDGESVVVAW